MSGGGGGTERAVERVMEVVGTHPSQRWKDGIRDAVDAAVVEAMCEFAEYLTVKAHNADVDDEHLFADGMRNAAVDAELFVPAIRGRWREGGRATGD